MTFGSPWLLWGTLLGAVPIVIHLLNRRTHREVPWAAMRFLLEATRKQSRRIRLEQLILLTVRTLILVLLAIALARPFVEATGLVATAPAGVHRVIVLDVSYGMEAKRDGETRFDAARAAVARIVAGSRTGDALNLVVMRSGGPRVLVGEPTFRHDEVLDELERIEPAHVPGDLPGTLRDVAALLEATEEPARKEVVYVGDLQRIDWTPTADAALAALGESLDRLDDAPLVLVDVGGSAANVAVTEVAIEESFVAAGRPMTIAATIANHGGEPVAGFPVELHVDGRLRDRRTADLPGTGEAPVDFSIAFDTPGEHLVEVRIAPDALPLDDVRRVAVRARERLSVLLVDGSPSGRFRESATAFVDVALVPDDTVAGGLIETRTIGEGELVDVELGRYDCVFLCNVGLVTDRETEVLRRYVESGGGLVIGLGDRVRLDNYNRTLHDTLVPFDDIGLERLEPTSEGVRVRTVVPGSPAHRAGLRDDWTIRSVDDTPTRTVDDLRDAIAGDALVRGVNLDVTAADGGRRVVRLRRPPLLPARLEKVVRTAANGPGHVFDAGNLEHPAVRAFDGNPEAGLLSTRIPHYAAVERATIGDARVVLAYDSGDPALLEHTVGRGTVLLVTTSLDRDWGGTWPGRPSFPQMVREMVGFVVRGRDGDRVLDIGQPLLRTFTTSAVGVTASVHRPDGRVDTLPIEGGGTAVAYDDVDLAGAYEFRVPPPIALTERFVANVDPVEADLQPAVPARLDEVIAGVRHQVRSKWSATAIADGESPAGGPVAVWLLTAVGCLLLVETVMAWRFGPGFSLLCALIAVTLLTRLVPWWAAATVVLAVSLAGLGWMRRVESP